MIPGMNQKQMKQAMKRMGMTQEEIEASQVIIKCPDREIVISPAQVSKVNMMGQETYQVVGEAVEKEISLEPELSEEDIQTVIEQTGVTREIAIDALEANKKDLASAIMHLQEDKEE